MFTNPKRDFESDAKGTLSIHEFRALTSAPKSLDGETLSSKDDLSTMMIRNAFLALPLLAVSMANAIADVDFNSLSPGDIVTTLYDGVTNISISAQRTTENGTVVRRHLTRCRLTLILSFC